MDLTVTKNNQNYPKKYSNEDLELIKSQICEGANDDEFKLFLKVCSQLRLDPFAKQIYSIKYGKKRVNQISIDGFRAIAFRTKLFAGKDAPIFQFEGNNKKIPLSATVTVYFFGNGIRNAVSETKYWDEYSPTYKGGVWEKMPKTMLAKCAEAAALRQAFQILSGVYSEDEMAQADPNGDDHFNGRIDDNDFVDIKKEKLISFDEGYHQALINFCASKVEEGIDNPVHLILDQFKLDIGDNDKNKITILGLSKDFKVQVLDWINKELS